jgi:hypothetical protein
MDEHDQGGGGRRVVRATGGGGGLRPGRCAAARHQADGRRRTEVRIGDAPGVRSQMTRRSARTPAAHSARARACGRRSRIAATPRRRRTMASGGDFGRTGWFNSRPAAGLIRRRPLGILADGAAGVVMRWARVGGRNTARCRGGEAPRRALHSSVGDAPTAAAGSVVSQGRASGQIGATHSAAGMVTAPEPDDHAGAQAVRRHHVGRRRQRCAVRSTTVIRRQ